MSPANLVYRWGNKLYKHAYPLYRPLYSAFKRYSDRTERAILARALGPGDVVVDGGANIGIYSQCLAQCVGNTGIVHAFEPDVENFARLRAAVSRLKNIRYNQIALSDTTGVSFLYISDDLNVDHRTYPTAENQRKSVTIQTTRLDDYFASGARVDFIKLDIQGYELHALRGAERVLADNPRIQLLLEFWPFGLQQAGGSAEGLITFLRDEGLATFVLRGNRLIECDPMVANPGDPMSYSNLFARRSGVTVSKSGRCMFGQLKVPR